MTLTDTEEMKTDHLGNKMDIGGSLRSALTEASSEGRLTCGVYESSKMLEINPDQVMMCILPENTDDVTLHIHFTLIEAYCWENDVRIMKVDKSDKLCKLLASSTRPPLDNEVNTLSSKTDFNCVLIQYPDSQCSPVEEDLMHFCKITSEASPLPVVELTV